MSTAADKDPVLAALPAEIRTRVEQTLASYEDKDEKKRPALAHNLWPEIPLPGEECVRPPLPKRPPRKPPGPFYCSGSQPADWVQRSIAMSKPRAPFPEAKPRQNLPAWNSSPSGKWKTPLKVRDPLF